MTGADGFLGKALLPRIAARGHEPLAAGRRNETPPGGAGPEGIEYFGVDLTKPLGRQELPEADVVVHLAQSRYFREFPQHADDIFAVNVRALAALLEHSRKTGVQRFVLASTGGVCATSQDPIPDGAPISPSSNFYLASKAASELLARPYADVFAVSVLRPFFIYGPGQRNMMISNLVSAVQEGRELTIDGLPGMRVNPTYIEDAANAFAAAVERDLSGPCNVAGDDVASITQIVELIGEIGGNRPLIRHDTSREPSGDLVAGTDRMADELQVAPSVSLREGLSRVIFEWENGQYGG